MCCSFLSRRNINRGKKEKNLNSDRKHAHGVANKKTKTLRPIMQNTQQFPFSPHKTFSFFFRKREGAMRVWGNLFLFLSRTRYSSLFSGAISRELTIPTSEYVERRVLFLPFLPLASNLNDQWGVIRSPPASVRICIQKEEEVVKTTWRGGGNGVRASVWGDFQTFLCVTGRQAFLGSISW